MLDDSTASIVPLHQTRRPKTAAERQRACRQRKRLQRQIALLAVSSDVPAEVLREDLSVIPESASPVTADVTLVTPAAALAVTPNVAPVTDVAALPVTANVTLVTSAAALPATACVTPVTAGVTLPVTANVTPATPEAASPVTANVTTYTKSRSHVTVGRRISSLGLTAAALALCGVAITTNGWFARSLGSTDLAGWLFFAVGVAADLVLLAVPETATQLWQAGKRATAAAAWAIWSIVSVFALTGGIGFASANIADATLARASRITPAVTAARAALIDAVTARDRECASGEGRICRARDQVVTERHRALEAAMSSVEHAADPQTDAAIKIVAWLSAGNLKPAADDFNMLRVVLLALLPQLGGLLLMIAGRARRSS
ncbi:hypothetical protein ACT4MK_36995 [Bradyrhizobium barranii]|uniref:hypothetical protein n=1 Tax=Bradyrhizobium TaxID=374 RepID=UPI003F23E74C